MGKNQLRKVVKVLSCLSARGVLELALHPLLVPFISIFAWVRTLWASRSLLYGQWSRYHGFKPYNVLNCFFYKTQWLNFDRYSRKGRSRLVGLGDYPLSRCFHLTLWSSFIYAHAGAVTTLCGTLIWIGSHMLWVTVVPWGWVAVVILALGTSSTAYAMAFVRQNYNIIGWMCLPCVFYGVMTGNFLLAALSLLAGAFASVSLVVSVVPLLFLQAAYSNQVEILVVLFPAVIKLCIHFLPMVDFKEAKSGVHNLAKLLGLSKRRVKYKRTSMRFGVLNLYFIALYGVGCSVLVWNSEYFPVLPVASLALFVVNQIFFRFMDDQSCYLIFCSAVAACIIQTPWSFPALLALVLVSNPLPVVMGLSSVKKIDSVTRIDPLCPFDHTELINGLDVFLSQVPAKTRVLMAFEDPKGKYESIFDGYRVILEPIIYVATKNDIHFMPSWYAVEETNYENAPTFWGRTPQNVASNMEQWNADFAIVYQDTGSELDPAWYNDFVVLSIFDWSDWVENIRGDAPWSSEKPPKWWLIGKKV